MATPTNVRFPEQVDRALAEYVDRTGARKATVVVGAVREWLRMQDHPGIVFVTTVTGERRAALATGPQVWTIAESWLQHDKSERSAAAVADALGLPESAVERALAYWSEFREEIDDLVEREHAGQNQALAAWERRQALNSI